MKIKKILFFTILFLIFFIPNCHANTEIIEFDFSPIVDTFNNYPYVVALKNIGIDIKAKQSGSDYILTYNDTDSVTFAYNEEETMFHAVYPFENRENSDILCSIFVDCISHLQGKEVGALLPFYKDDAFSLTFFRNDGISREYLSSEAGGIVVDCKLNPFIKLNIPESKESIPENVFILNTLNFFEKNSCMAKNNDLICYKTIIDENNYELDVGQSNSLNDLSFDTAVTALSLISSRNGINKEKVIQYIKQNYTGFEKGDYEFDGIKIETDITELPVVNQDTILVGNNMKYAKITVDKKLFEQKANEIKLNNSNSFKTENSDNKVVVGIVVIYLAIMDIVAGIVVGHIIKRK